MKKKWILKLKRHTRFEAKKEGRKRGREEGKKGMKEGIGKPSISYLSLESSKYIVWISPFVIWIDLNSLRASLSDLRLLDCHTFKCWHFRQLFNDYYLIWFYLSYCCIHIQNKYLYSFNSRKYFLKKQLYILFPSIGSCLFLKSFFELSWFSWHFFHSFSSKLLTLSSYDFFF